MMNIILQVSVWQIVQETSTFGAFILLVLTLMSVISWVVIFHKWRQFKAVNRDNTRFLQHFRKTRFLGEFREAARAYPSSPMAAMSSAGIEEIVSLVGRQDEAQREQGRAMSDTEFDVLEMTLERSMTEEMGKLERLVVFLATTASAAPFMGLLGTVVGIMDAFWSIGERGSASLAIVAPGIAEALLATIVGLGAAIPAVIAYNWANTRNKFLHDASNGFILEFLARAKKELG